MPRFKAPKGTGNPVIAGVELKPGPGGVYVSGDPVAIEHMKAAGFHDLDAPPSAAAAAAAVAAPAASPVLHGAVVKALAEHGISVPEKAGEDILVKALGDLTGVIADKIKAAEQAAEERVLKELADKADKKK